MTETGYRKKEINIMKDMGMQVNEELIKNDRKGQLQEKREKI